jgi:mannose/fructose-specific phosphotransferase system component IIA
MPLGVTMKDVMVTEVVDEDFHDALTTLNKAGNNRENFIVMSDMDGGNVMLNVANILMLKELPE